MSVLFKSFFILINFFSIILAKQHVPVLLWSSSIDLPSVPSLKQLSSVGFGEVLQDALVTSQPLITVFIEEDLSSEEFKARSTFGKTLYDDLESSGINDNLLYLPSVAKPIDAINDLSNTGYEVLEYNGNIPSDITKPTIILVNLQDKKDNDASYSKELINIYNKIVKAYPDTLAIYTGRQNTWAQKLFKRARRETTDPPSSALLIRSDGFVIVAEKIMYASDGVNMKPLTTVVNVSIAPNTSDDKLTNLEVEFNDGIKLTFSFQGTSDTWQWSLVKLIDNSKELIPSTQLWGPRQWSWHCGQDVLFKSSTNKNDAPVHSDAQVVMTGLQVQVGVSEGGSFGQAIDCVPYFSIGIWTGIVVVLLMLTILTWGLLMLMDINNNDRFDDPKGKTITISATE